MYDQSQLSSTRDRDSWTKFMIRQTTVPIYSSTVTITVKLSHLHPPTSQSIETTKSWIFGDDAITTGVARSPLAHLLMQNHPQPQQWWQSKCWPVSGGCAYLVPTCLEKATLQQQQRNNKRALRFAIRIGHSWNSIVVARALPPPALPQTNKPTNEPNPHEPDGRTRWI